jgi:hypothetical protein
MIKCICINDKNRPPEIPESHWVKFGSTYVVLSIETHVQPAAMLGVVLLTPDLAELNLPYKSFQIGRFGFAEEDLPALMTMINSSPDLQSLDPMLLISEEILTGKTLEDFDGYIEFEGDEASLGEL